MSDSSSSGGDESPIHEPLRVGRGGILRRNLLLVIALTMCVTCLAGCWWDESPSATESIYKVFASDRHDSTLLNLHVGTVNSADLSAERVQAEISILSEQAEKRREILAAACDAKDAVELGQAESITEALPPIAALSGDEQTEAVATATKMLIDEDSAASDAEQAGVYYTCKWAHGD